MSRTILATLYAVRPDVTLHVGAVTNLAYVAITRYRTANDFRPYLYKFSDYGAKWAKISDSFGATARAKTSASGLGSQSVTLPVLRSMAAR